MKHFTDEIWFDYARGVLPLAKAELARRHLDEGCDKCKRMYEIWTSLVQFVQRDTNYEPAEAAVRIAKAGFAEQWRTNLLPRQARMARLLFDSFRDPAVAAFGVRSAVSRARQMLHRTGSWTIDLRLESEGGRTVSVTGQVLRSGRKPAEALSMDVLLMRGDTLVAQTAANQFGEFRLECEYQNDLHVYLDIVGCRPVGIALPDPDQ
jgi:hypothetical protein